MVVCNIHLHVQSGFRSLYHSVGKLKVCLLYTSRCVYETDIISCFDVSESGLVAVGSATYGNQYIYVYDATGKFQYGQAFNNPGSYGLQWDGSDLIIYFVRSDIAALVDSEGNIKELKVKMCIRDSTYRQ